MNSKASFAFALAAVLGLGGYTVFKLADGLGTPKAETTAVALQALPKGYARIRPADFDRGYVLRKVTRGEHHDFTAPSSAAYATNWYLRGAASGYQRFAFTRWRFPFKAGRVASMPVFANGDVQMTDGELLPSVLGTLGVVPSYNWDRMPTTCQATCPPLGIQSKRPLGLFWHTYDNDSVKLTWQNALLDREAAKPVSAQVELRRNGNFSIRLDLSRVPAGDPVFGRLYQLCGDSNATTLAYHRLDPIDRTNDDRDGDMLTTEEEILDRQTDPGKNDSDGDSLTDRQEIRNGTDPFTLDSDGDGYMDATDPDPKRTTSWADADGDGIPDAWKAKWFPNGPVDKTGDAGGDGIPNWASLYVGVNPTTTWGLGTAAHVYSLPDNVNAYKLAPTAFSFTRPEGLTTLIDRSFSVGRISPWQQLFVTANLERPEGWFANDVALTWSCGDESGDIPLDTWDSYRIPLSANAVRKALRITLTATGPRPMLNRPLYLVRWMPHLEFPSNPRVTQLDVGHTLVMVQNSPSDGSYALPFVRHDDGYPSDAGMDDGVRADLACPILPELTTYGSAFSVENPIAVNLPPEGLKPQTVVMFYEVRWYMPILMRLRALWSKIW